VAIDAVVDAEAVRVALNLTPAFDAVLTSYALRGERRLKKVIGSTNYAAALAETLTSNQADACSFAGARFGASAFLLERIKAVADKGVVSVSAVGDGVSDTFASVPEVREWAKALRTEAIRDLKDEGLYQQPALVIGTAVAVDEDEDD
jgi:hypothetical protein